jgi:hypothetical protein
VISANSDLLKRTLKLADCASISKRGPTSAYDEATLPCPLRGDCVAKLFLMPERAILRAGANAQC